MLSAVVVAAGTSNRLGTSKQLLPFGDRTVLETVVGNILRSGIEEVVVVLGHAGDQIRPLLQHLPVAIVLNQEYKSGMTGSVQTGIRHCSHSATGYMICLGDMPLIRDTEYARLAATFEQVRAVSPRPIVVPYYDSKRGNPVIFHKQYKTDLLALPEMNGCGQLVRQNLDQIVQVDMENDHIHLDIDTEENYREALSKLAAIKGFGQE